MQTALPKRLGHIWIGPKPAPDRWMQTWPDKHPDWEYTVYDNDFLVGFPFRLRPLINEYWWRGLYAGVQDMMRYEILYAFGGFMADAGAICRHPVDELLTRRQAYTVYDRPEDDRWRGVCPVLACEPGNPFVGAVIDRLASQSPALLRKAEVSTGNRFLMRMIRELAPPEGQLAIWPTHYFVPWQKSDPSAHYDGPDKVYAEQQWGTSFYAYNRADGPSSTTFTAEEIVARRDEVTQRLIGAQGRRLSPFARQDRCLADRVLASRTGLRKQLDDPLLHAKYRTLGRRLETRMAQLGKPARFHGMHFYRHMQSNPISQSPLRSRSINSRIALLSWLAQARHALMIGFDTGHLPLSALHLFPDLRLTCVERGFWPLEKDDNPPQKSAYSPAAADWLNQRFPGRITAATENERGFLKRLKPQPDDPFDMLVFPSSDIDSLETTLLATDHLADAALVVFASTEDDSGQAQADRILLQGIGWLPLERISFGPARGSLAVLRLDRQAARSLRRA